MQEVAMMFYGPDLARNAVELAAKDPVLVADFIPGVGAAAHDSIAVVDLFQGKFYDAVNEHAEAENDRMIDSLTYATGGLARYPMMALRFAARGGMRGLRFLGLGARSASELAEAALRDANVASDAAARAAANASAREAAAAAVRGAEGASEAALRAAEEAAANAAEEAAAKAAEEATAKAAANAAEEAAAKAAEEAAAKAAAKKAAQIAAENSLPGQLERAGLSPLDMAINLALGLRAVAQEQETPQPKEPEPPAPLHHEDRPSDGPLDLTQPQIPHGAAPLVVDTRLGDVNVNLGVDLASLYRSVLNCKCPC